MLNRPLRCWDVFAVAGSFPATSFISHRPHGTDTPRSEQCPVSVASLLAFCSRDTPHHDGSEPYGPLCDRRTPGLARTLAFWHTSIAPKCILDTPHLSVWKAYAFIAQHWIVTNVFISFRSYSQFKVAPSPYFAAHIQIPYFPGFYTERRPFTVCITTQSF